MEWRDIYDKYVSVTDETAVVEDMLMEDLVFQDLK